MKNPRNNEVKYFTLQRKVISYKTYESWTTVPHVTFIYEADVAGLVSEFHKLKRNTNISVTLNTLLLKICVEAIKAAPQVNAHIQYNPKYVTGQIEIIKDINISTPWVLDDGSMITINLRNFESKTLVEMQTYIDNIKRKIKNSEIYIPMYQTSVDNMMDELKKGRLLKSLRALLGSTFGKSRTAKYSKKDIKVYHQIPMEDKITKRDLVPGTVTVSNLGSVYKEQKGFMGILEIIPPQVFAIGIGGIQEKPGIIVNERNEKSVGIKKVLPMCLAFDHRELNFNEIVPFIQKLDYIFDHPESLHTW